MNKRLKRLQQMITQDVAIFTNRDQQPNPNFLYYAGVNVSGFLIVPKDKPAFILVYSRDHLKAKASGLTLIKLKKGEGSAEQLRYWLDRKRLTYNRIALDKDNYMLLSYEKIRKELRGRYYDISLQCLEQRAVKSKEELKSFREACRITDDAFSRLVKNFRFRTELEVRNFLEAEIRKQGAKLSFEPIVAFGRNGAIPHYEGNSGLGRGLLLLDYGACYHGYHADMSRTICIGEPANKEARMYDKVLEVQQSCIGYAKPGIPAGEIYDSAVSGFGELSDNFVHALGHGVGLQIHEAPSLSPGSEQILLKDMCLTIEPGLYFEGEFGIRIEDTVRIDKKNEIMTRSQKKLIQVDIDG